MYIAIPSSAKLILDTLHQAGYEAYVVGGCVRDALLNRTADDWDITTNAKPLQVKQLFRHTVDTGLQHGTVTVIVNREGFEVTTYRVDGAYEKHRRPTAVSFTSELKEDMLRRDFTINAMAYNEEEGLVDYFHGQEDLAAGVIRCVGVAMERFDEDALRVLRALRFAAQLGFAIAPDTLAAMRAKAGFLADISAERIRVELTKLLLSDQPECLGEIGYTCGITAVVLPELDAMMKTAQENRNHCYSVGEHSLKAVSYIEATPVLRWAALLHDVGKPDCKTMDEAGVAHFYGHAKQSAERAHEIMRRLKFDNDTVKRVRELVYWHDYNWGDHVDSRRVRRAAARIGPDYMEDLGRLQRADVLAQSDFMRQEKLDLLDTIATLYAQVQQEQQCLTLKQLAIDGSDLMELGMRPGKQIGEVLKRLLEHVIEVPSDNERQILRQMAQDIINQTIQ